MRIETITCFYNEEFLLPFYLKHYSWVDRMNFLLDSDTNDGSSLILAEAKAKFDINIVPITFSEGMDNITKMEAINVLYKEITSDFVLNVDIDEFIFIDRETTETINNDVTFVRLANVYRNVNEKDLDINIPIREQRRHGEFLPVYRKPIVAKGGKRLWWGVGNHGCNIVAEDKGIVGAHWAMADPCFCIDRRVNNRVGRFSKRNLSYGMSCHVSSATRESLIAECELHKNDKELW